MQRETGTADVADAHMPTLEDPRSSGRDSRECDMADNISSRFYRRADWLAFGVAFGVALAVYVATLAPTVTLEDSGELAVAADYLGVPHPPGYPIWTLLAWLFQSALAFVPFRGHPNPAWGVGLLSAVSGALASGLIALLVSRSGSDLLRRLRHAPATPHADRAACCAGISGALLFAFSPAMWSQSVIIEVYALNALFLALILTLAYRWLQRPSDRTLCWIAFLFGLGLTNYQVLLLMGLSLVVMVMVRDLMLFRDFLIAALMVSLAVVIVKLGSLPSLQGFPKYPPGHADVALSMYIPIAIASVAAMIGGLATAMRRPYSLAAWAVFGLVAMILAVLVSRAPVAPGSFSPASQTVSPFSWNEPGYAIAGAFVVLALLCAPNRVLRAAGLAFAAIALPAVIGVRKGIVYGLVHPTSAWFWFYVTINAFVLIIIYHMLPRGRVVALSLLCAEAGAAFYVFMPLVSESLNPPMNWAYPLSWEGFKHAISRGQYADIEVGIDTLFTRKYVDQIGVYLHDLRRQFTLLAVPFGLLPFAAWRLRIGRRHASGVAIGCVLVGVVTTAVFIEKVILHGGTLEPVRDTYRLAFGAVTAIAALGLLVIVMRIVVDHLLQVTGRSSTVETRIAAAIPVVAVGAGYLFAAWKLSRQLGGGLDVTGLPLAAMVGLIAVAPMAALCVAWLGRRGEALRMDIDEGAERWLATTLAGFAAMSLLLVSLANLRGDLQDTFVQRVKFISSHAIFAVWIGIGLALALGHIERWFPSRRRLWLAAAGCVVLLPLVPIHQNALNPRLVREMGGAEQRGHDFGWQFGYYQITGAEGISEELGPGEEPLPNPDYPPPMERDAIFFGGTDPGRFVPTYMIYSAHVRNDIYLITQNSLADGPYLNVMRDLYGDDIWIPDPRDNSLAFTQYLLDRHQQKNRAAEVAVRGGSVRIEGAREIMKINARLAERIYDHNRFRHAFYVEESYVLPWMDSYLVPHGLVMKLDHAKRPLRSRLAVRDDDDFWDWYTRRLCATSRFRRDVVARRSFSKLRSSIAGLYARHDMKGEAEAAYAQALALYPPNPGANMHLIQKILIPAIRFEEARARLRRFQLWDRNNSGLSGVLSDIDRIESAYKDRLELHRRALKPDVTVGELLKLAEIYHQAGRTNTANTLAGEALKRSIGVPSQAMQVGIYFFDRHQYDLMVQAFDAYRALQKDSVPTEHLSRMIGYLQEAGHLRGIIHTLQRHLSQTPSDVHARINLGVLQIILKEYEEALASFREAIGLDGDQARRLIREDPRLQPVFAIEPFRSLLGKPGQ